jgi:hypothetical protein
MSAYALPTGKTIPPEAAASLSLLEAKFGSDPLSELVVLHNQLAIIVSPALPGSVADLYKHAARSKFKQRLAPVPIARSMAVVGLIFVVVFFGIGLFPEIDDKNLNSDMLRSSGCNLLLVQLFLLSAAGAGACFANLFDILKSVSSMTFLPTFASEYWVKLALGIIAGLLLAELIPVSHVPLDLASGASETATQNPMQKPLVALVGGFSANILYVILNRLTETVENLFAPKASSKP